MNTSELKTKLQKYSATQLISKMEKGVENEEEKSIIIGILVKRGKDVTPFQDKTPEQIKEEAKLDKAQKKESAKALSESKPKAEKKEKKQRQKIEGKSKKEIFYEDATFSKGTKVRILNDSKKVAAGTEGEIVRTGYPESRPDDHFAYVRIELNGKKTTCGRMLRFLEVVK